MRRRDFLSVAAATLSGSRWSHALSFPEDIRITRIVGFDLLSARPRYLGRNSRREVHGDKASDPMIRLYTNAGIEGLGACRAKQEDLARLLGMRLSEFFQSDERVFHSPLGASTMALWDLLGKATGKPVYRLLCDAAASAPAGARPARKHTPVYDGSIYFSDLLPENAGQGVDLFKREIDMGLARGHRTFKIKIGRGAKWMRREEGYHRDLAVLKTIRAHAGPEIGIAVDANDGLDLAMTKRLLSDLPDFNFLFIEEMFPDDVKKYQDLKAFIHKHGWKTLIADGENANHLDKFRPWIDGKAVDIYQGDIHQFGFEGIIAESRMAAPHGMWVAPHNWGSLIGFYMQLHLGLALPNFYSAEEDPMSSPALIAEGYEIKNGVCSVPDAPGMGLRLDESKLTEHTKVHFDLKAT